MGTYAALARLTDRRAPESRVRSGDVVRDGRGRYALPAADEAKRAANSLTGVVSHLSAALHWGWEVKTVPTRPLVSVPRHRNLAAGARAIDAALSFGATVGAAPDSSCAGGW